MAELSALPASYAADERADHDADEAPSISVQRSRLDCLASATAWPSLDLPGLVEACLALGRTDIPMARLTEGHADALRILKEADMPALPGIYGVWASRSAGTGLRGQMCGGRWQASGRLRFASGAGLIDRALIPIWTDDQTHRLVDVDVSEWAFDTTEWKTTAMALSHSHSTVLDDVDLGTRAVGADDFYLDRRGFFPGGIGVAAVWAGGAARLLDLLAAAHADRERPDAVAARWGHVRTEIATAAAVCRQAALEVERTADDRLGLLATECRAATAAAVRRLIGHVRTLAGAVVAFEGPLARAIDDLQLYVAQQNEDKDAVALGRSGG